MEGDYQVFWGNQQVGKVCVQRQGLYYKFHCRCNISGGTVCRLRVVCDGLQETLGILVPEDGGFGLDSRIPVKRFPQGIPAFFLVPNHDRMKENFAPIYPEEPFSYISKLKNGYLVRRNGEIGIIMK